MPRMTELTWAIFGYGLTMAFVTLIVQYAPDSSIAQSINSFKLLQGISGLYAVYFVITFPYSAWIAFGLRSLRHAVKDVVE